MPLVAVTFMEQLASVIGLAEAELILVAKFEHTANRFFPARLLRKFCRLEASRRAEEEG